MADQAVKDFGAYLAGITDDAERARAFSAARMLAAQSAPEEAFEPPIRTLGDYLAMEIEIPPVLVHPKLVVRGGLNATIGRAGKGKTVMNLNRMLRWSAGQPMFPGWTDGEGEDLLAPERPLKILVVENEGAAGLFHQQIGIMLHADGFLDSEARDACRENLLVWGEGGYSGLKFDDPAKLNGVRRGVEKWEPDIVFIEPFRSLWSGEENSSTEMNVVVDALIGLATDYNCGVLISHHERKSGAGEGDNIDKMNSARGSSVLEGAVTVMENFEGVKGGDFRELSWSKSRHGAPPAPVRMEWVPDAWWYKWVPQSRIHDAIIEALQSNADEPMTLSDLVMATDEKKAALSKAIKILIGDDKVKQMPSISGPGGSTGFRYVLPNIEGATGGLAL